MSYMARVSDISPRENALREDLGKEYYAILGVISEYDGRFMVIKGWSVTLSLAALGLGFQQRHYALFALAGATALAFWFMDVLMKGFQLRYYGRMRDIEYAAFKINAVDLGELGHTSAPRIDMSWAFVGAAGQADWRVDPPARRSVYELHRLVRRPWFMLQVLLPHAAAVFIGSALFIAAVLGAPGFRGMQP
jgi:hypothetical protein